MPFAAVALSLFTLITQNVFCGAFETDDFETKPIILSEDNIRNNRIRPNEQTIFGFLERGFESSPTASEVAQDVLDTANNKAGSGSSVIDSNPPTNGAGGQDKGNDKGSDNGSGKTQDEVDKEMEQKNHRRLWWCAGLVICDCVGCLHLDCHGHSASSAQNGGNENAH